MSTNKKIAANRRNSQKSKGPKTPEGKTVSSANSTKHGLCASKTILLPTEDPEAFAQLHERMRGQLMPAGELEEVLVERIVVALWKLDRLDVFEAGVLTLEYYEGLELNAQEKAFSSAQRIRSLLPYVDDEALHGKRQVRDQPSSYRETMEADTLEALKKDPLSTLGLAFVRTTNNGGDPLSKLNRYHVTIERSFYLALHELQRIQAARRQGQSVHAPPAVDVTIIGEPAPKENVAVEDL